MTRHDTGPAPKALRFRPVIASKAMVMPQPKPGGPNMSKRASDFVTNWIDDNISAEPYVGDNDPRPAKYARDCLIEAEKEQIYRGEIEEDLGELEVYMGQAIDKSANNEVNRLVGKDRS